jgi:hypothetical protein
MRWQEHCCGTTRESSCGCIYRMLASLQARASTAATPCCRPSRPSTSDAQSGESAHVQRAVAAERQLHRSDRGCTHSAHARVLTACLQLLCVSRHCRASATMRAWSRATRCSRVRRRRCRWSPHAQPLRTGADARRTSRMYAKLSLHIPDTTWQLRTVCPGVLILCLPVIFLYRSWRARARVSSCLAWSSRFWPASDCQPARSGSASPSWSAQRHGVQAVSSALQRDDSMALTAVA